MASIYQLKPAFQGLLRPLSNTLARRGITANQVTIAAAVLSGATGLILAIFPMTPAVWFLVPLVMFVRMAMNAIDGMLAREHNMQSDLGAILNEVGDVVSDAVLYLPFCFLPGVSPTLVVLFVWLSGLSEMTGIVGVQIGASRRYDGPSGKSDRAALMGAFALIYALGWSLGTWSNVLLTIACLGICWTIWNRARGALAEKGAS